MGLKAMDLDFDKDEDILTAVMVKNMTLFRQLIERGIAKFMPHLWNIALEYSESSARLEEYIVEQKSVIKHTNPSKDWYLVLKIENQPSKKWKTKQQLGSELKYEPNRYDMVDHLQIGSSSQQKSKQQQ